MKIRDYVNKINSDIDYNHYNKCDRFHDLSYLQLNRIFIDRGAYDTEAISVLRQYLASYKGKWIFGKFIRSDGKLYFHDGIEYNKLDYIYEIDMPEDISPPKFIESLQDLLINTDVIDFKIV